MSENKFQDPTAETRWEGLSSCQMSWAGRWLGQCVENAVRTNYEHDSTSMKGYDRRVGPTSFTHHQSCYVGFLFSWPLLFLFSIFPLLRHRWLIANSWEKPHLSSISIEWSARPANVPVTIYYLRRAGEVQLIGDRNASPWHRRPALAAQRWNSWWREEWCRGAVFGVFCFVTSYYYSYITILCTVCY